MMTKSKPRYFRFAAKAGASNTARDAVSNRGTASTVRATTERGARRILKRRLGATVTDELYLCHEGD